MKRLVWKYFKVVPGITVLYNETSLNMWLRNDPVTKNWILCTSFHPIEGEVPIDIYTGKPDWNWKLGDPIDE